MRIFLFIFLQALKILQNDRNNCIDNIMIAGVWNLLEHTKSCLDLFLYCQDNNITIHLAGIFASGLLCGGDTCHYRVANSEEIEKTKRWQILCNKFNVSLPAVAMAFALQPAVVTGIAIGVKSIEELNENVNNFKNITQKEIIPNELFIEAKAIGLIESFVNFY